MKKNKILGKTFINGHGVKIYWADYNRLLNKKPSNIGRFKCKVCKLYFTERGLKIHLTRNKNIQNFSFNLRPTKKETNELVEFANSLYDKNKYFYIKRSGKNKVRLIKEDFKKFIPEIRLPITEKNLNDRCSNCLTAGWNEYRIALLDKLGIEKRIKL